MPTKGYQVSIGERVLRVQVRREADAADSPHEAVRALGNLGYLLLTWGLPRDALPYIDEVESRMRKQRDRSI